MSGAGDQDDGFVVKLRGLPWSVTTEDILKFFDECDVMNGKNGVHLTTSREGRPSGEAYVEFETQEDLELALVKDRDHIGSRYIEVFKVDKSEMEWMVKRSGPSFGSNDDGCVRLRGLPFGCSGEEIAQFFTGLEIVPNGITLLTDYSGRSSGEAYVQFVNKDVAEKALQKHREKIGHRYIEIFRSSLFEIASALGYTGNNRRTGGGSFNPRPSPYDRGDRYGGGGGGGGGRFQGRGSRSFKGSNFSNDYNSFNNRSSGGWSGGNQNGGGRFMDPWSSNSGNGGGGGGSSGGGSVSGMHCVHMRGLPFKASQLDIADFFKPVMPVSIHLLQDHSGRASGEADVEFANHDDALRAMSKDKSNMQHRYIELFLNSSGGGGGGGSGYGGRRRL